MSKVRLFLTLSCWMLIASANGQALYNKQIDDAQKVLCKVGDNGKCITTIGNNKDINLISTMYVVDKVDNWQQTINNEKTYSQNDKIKYLRILLNYVNEFNKATLNKRSIKDYTAGLSKELFEDFSTTIDAHLKKTSLANAITNKGILASRIIAYNEFAPLALGYKEAHEAVVYKECITKPETILDNLNKYPTLQAADSLIILAAFNNQDKLYDYAQCTKCPVSFIIKRSTNGLVKTLYQMAQMETGRSLTPFLDEISSGKITIDSINKLQQDINQYYKLLVNTRISYSKRLDTGEDILAIKNFNNKIKETALDYVKEINELHTKADAIRFARLTPLNTQELYYLAIYGIDELYTSSFNRGVFAQIIAKLNGLSTDKLLAQVNNDYFRKFIKISAGYNQLSKFLKLMPDSSAKVVMNNFISNLVQNDNYQDIEDAVDVADAYVGIGANQDLKSISDQILVKVNEYAATYKIEENKKGETVYKLFNQIFKAYKDTTINLSAQLGIPSITKVAYNDLATPKTNGKVMVKLYFYGDEDKDGQLSFQNFMNLFSDKTRWKIEGNPWYVNIQSIKGKPIQIFANRALYDATKKTDPDDTAKLKMSEYMVKQGLQPTFVMHRGHSYHVPITLNYMEKYDTSAKLIVLGSCGGYQNLQKVLEICPNAHIVSSKQTGTMYVNDPMLRLLFLELGIGKDIVWPSYWQNLKPTIAKDKLEMFEEYIPPNKNLGMIFIKAYKKQMDL